MIKIIKQGNPNRKTKHVYEHECIVCGCIFEFELDDLDGNIFGDVSICCPCCKNNLGIILKNAKSKIVEIKENNNE